MTRHMTTIIHNENSHKNSNLWRSVFEKLQECLHFCLLTFEVEDILLKDLIVLLLIEPQEPALSGVHQTTTECNVSSLELLQKAAYEAQIPEQKSLI